MSIRVMSWVWENSPASGSELLLLLAIADFGDDDGIAFPKVEKLVKKARMSRASVFRSLKSLREDGSLEITQRGRASQYRIIMDGLNVRPQKSQSETDEESQAETPVSDCDSRGLNPETSEVSLLRHRTVTEPPLNQDSLRSSSTPRKRGSAATTKRGSRIPDDFTVTEEMRQWGRENAPGVNGDRETTKFINHFHSAPGSKGVKVDWVRTWQNWILNAADRFQPTGSGVAIRSNGAGAPRLSTTDQRIAELRAAGESLKAQLYGSTG